MSSRSTLKGCATVELHLVAGEVFNPDRVGFVSVCNPKVETVDFNLGLCCEILLEFHSLGGLALGYRFAVFLVSSL